MQLIERPNLPINPVQSVIIDGRINKKIEAALQNLGIELYKTDPSPALYKAISYHPDIVFHHLRGNRIVYAPGNNEIIVDKLKKKGFCMIEGSTYVSCKYPSSAAYNVARVGNLAFHDFRYTDPVLKNQLEALDVKLVQVKQGYTKCSISVVNEKCIITSDVGISKAAEKHQVEVLLIEPEEGAILLPGLNYGFIGGCTALLDNDKWAITGSIRTLKSCNKIIDFLKYKKIGVIQLSDEQVVDIGSIIPII